MCIAKAIVKDCAFFLMRQELKINFFLPMKSPRSFSYVQWVVKCVCVCRMKSVVFVFSSSTGHIVPLPYACDRLIALNDVVSLSIA